MEEPVGAQYAIQIAVHTLKERCRTLQHRIAELEEENVNLKITCLQAEHKNQSLTESDKVRQNLTEVTQQNKQLQNTIDMVTTENKELWSKLGKLTKVNHNLGTQLNKINDTISNHTSTLIRSKTFTQVEPHSKLLQKNLEENDKISLELENISLKLIDSFSKEKQELEALCYEIKDLQNVDAIVTENFAFYCDEDIGSDMFNDFYAVLEEIKVLKNEALQDQNLLKMCILKIKEYEKNLAPKVECSEKSTITDELIPVKEATSENTEHHLSASLSEIDKICPICSKSYYKNTAFEEFQQHVEDHFSGDSYEIV
ncbi:unnamed protein product [Brassicogethes aeneus]|uniref:UBZ1-type domain-containing protein n=1 Tax=Brassicogethes aeneus TaxID=1431903 RepID=A0A9P0FH60_BRAAE|nr:unnamed protein product [Brassicogethes aeneus]